MNRTDVIDCMTPFMNLEQR